MFDLGWSEILVIAIVLIVVVGPKDLPRVLRSFGRTTSKLRVMAGDFRRQFDEALKEAELDEVKSLVDDVRKLDPRNEIKKHFNPLEQAGRDLKSSIDDVMKPTPAKPVEDKTDDALADAPDTANEVAASTPAKLVANAEPASLTDKADKKPAANAPARKQPAKTSDVQKATKPAVKKPAVKKDVAEKVQTSAKKQTASTKPKAAAKTINKTDTEQGH